MSLLKYHEVIVASYNAAVNFNKQCLRPHRKLILTAILLKISQFNLKMIPIQKIEKFPYRSKLR